MVLVRHGQATPFEEVTDRLSALGEAQSRKLGEYWKRNGVVFDEVYTGSLTRQRRTEELVRTAGWPTPEVLPELNEYDADAVVKKFAPRVAAKDPEFQRMFEPLMNRWITGELDSPAVESWRCFRERVERGLRRITGGHGRGRRVVAFTSGGPIGVAVQLALAAPDRSALELNWRVRNCSLTEFLFSGGRLSLDTFNAIPHLDDPALRSFR